MRITTLNTEQHTWQTNRKLCCDCDNSQT